MSRRKKGINVVYAMSIGAHVVLGLVIAFIPKDKLREVVAIALAEAPKRPEKKPEPPKHEEAPKHTVRAHGGSQLAKAAAQAAPEPNAPVFTDIGIALDSSSADGIAVRTAPKSVETARPTVVAPPKPKVLVAHGSECSEEIVKAKPEQVVRPEYTQAARAANVEGRVRVELLIDEQGEVKSARVVSGLGYGLDEAALAAAQRMRFRPALRCGKSVAAPFVISMRFVRGA